LSTDEQELGEVSTGTSHYKPRSVDYWWRIEEGGKSFSFERCRAAYEHRDGVPCSSDLFLHSEGPDGVSQNARLARGRPVTREREIGRFVLDDDIADSDSCRALNHDVVESGRNQSRGEFCSATRPFHGSAGG